MDKALEFILALVIIGVTLAFGGVQPWAYSLMEAGLFLSALLLVLRQTRRGRIGLPLPLWPMLFLLLVVLQVVPLPSWFVVNLSPARLQESGLSRDRWVWTTLSIYPHDTVLLLVRFLAYLSAFVLAAYFFDSRKGKSTLFRSLILLGSFEAAYGIVQYLTGSHKIFTFEKQINREMATGTYINYNHFAGLLELVLPFVVASSFYSFQLWSEGRRVRSGRGDFEGTAATGFQCIFFLFLTVIIVVAIVLSHSRMGILASVFSILFIAVLAQLKVRQKAWTVAIILFLFCASGYGLWIGLEPVLLRFEELGERGYLQMEGRLALWKDGLRLLGDYPLLGSGLGTFAIAYRQYQTSGVNYFADHIHNDYLEFAAETGLLGVALLFLPILYLFTKMIISFLDDPRRYRRAVTLGCIGSTLALLLHSITDFNLQIPANALIFAVVLGIGYKATMLERRDEQADSLRFVPDAAREPNFMAAHRREFGSLNRQ